MSVEVEGCLLSCQSVSLGLRGVSLLVPRARNKRQSFGYKRFKISLFLIVFPSVVKSLSLSVDAIRHMDSCKSVPAVCVDV